MKTAKENCPQCDKETIHDSEIKNRADGVPYRPGTCRECGMKRALPMPHELYTMPYGKHKGVPLPQVPRDYLEWFANSDLPYKTRIKIIEYLRKTSDSLHASSHKPHQP